MIILLIVYVLLLIAYVGYSAAGIYHLLRFGYVGDLTRPAILVYVAISVFVILFTFILIFSREWSGPSSVPSIVL